MPTLVSIQVGSPTVYPAEGKNPLAKQPWTTGIFKTSVDHSVSVNSTGVVGDGQADLQHHGGVDKAICVYSVDHFEFWRRYLGRSDFGAGGFGENFSVAKFNEQNVSLGDRWKIGSAEFEISQPRQPCWKLARRWDCKAMTAETIANGKTGWYMRVIKPGRIAPGEPIELLPPADTAAPQMTIAQANVTFYQKRFDRQSLSRLASVPALSASWRTETLSRISKG